MADKFNEKDPDRAALAKAAADRAIAELLWQASPYWFRTFMPTEGHAAQEEHTQDNE